MTTCMLWLTLLLAMPNLLIGVHPSPAESPRNYWTKAKELSYGAAIKVRQRRLTEALTLLSQSREQLQKLRSKWPHYRRLRISREIHTLHKQRSAIYQLVANQGLVEYQGRFYTFAQIRQFMAFQQERTAKWMEVLKAQEETRRAKTVQMVEEESKRQVELHRMQAEKRLKEQERFMRDYKRLQEDNRRRQMDRNWQSAYPQRPRKQDQDH